MPDSGAASHGRPLCRCHGVPMDMPGASSMGGPACAVRRRERQNARRPHLHYYAGKRRLRLRIERKRQQVKELEAQLHEAQNTD